MRELTLVLCGLAAAGLLAVGILALLLPQRLSRSYGVPVKGAPAIDWVRATGARDTALGLIFASAVYLRDHRTLLILCLAGLALSLADFAIAFGAANKRVRSEHGAHIGGAIGFAVLVILLAQAAGP